MRVKFIDWNQSKNEKLKKSRGIGFDDVVTAFSEDHLLDDFESKSRLGQRIFVVNINDYAYAIPYVEDEEKIFLKTIYPSRKFTKKYLEQK